LERERPAYDIFQDTLYFIKDKTIRSFNFHTAKESQVLVIKRGHPGQSPAPKTLSFNPAENSFLISTGQEESNVEMYQQSRGNTNSGPTTTMGASAVYVARNRMVIVERGLLVLKDLQNATIQEMEPKINGKILKITQVFYSGGKNVLATTDKYAIIYDLEKNAILYDIQVSGIRYISMSADSSMIALLSKHSIVIADSKLDQMCLITESIKIKSGAWDPSGVFVYSTLNHIKYAITNGDVGIIRTIIEPIYIARVRNNIIHCLTRDGTIDVLPFDPTEYQFKTALMHKNFEVVFKMIETSNLMGQAIIGYLQKKGFPEIALQFVKDPKTRFDLALECGNIEVALEMAKTIDKEQYWEKLGVEASVQGNQKIMEFVYQKTKSFDTLSFLYLCLGDTLKIKKMLKIAESRKDTMGRYQNALFCGDVREQVRILAQSGQLSLAYLTANTYGLHDDAQMLLEAAGVAAPLVPENPLLTKNPTAIFIGQENWPINSNNQSNVKAAVVAKNAITSSQSPTKSDLSGWGDAELDDFADSKRPKSVDAFALELEDLGADGWGETELEVPGFAIEKEKPKEYIPIECGRPYAEGYKSSPIASDHISAGDFEAAMEMLNEQAGICNFEPLKPFFQRIFQSANAFAPATALCPPLKTPMIRSIDYEGNALPMNPFTIDSLITRLQKVYPVMTAGKFGEAEEEFRGILFQSIFTLTKSQSENLEIKELVTVCREYLVGLASEAERKKLGPNDSKRSLELASYFTHCGIQTIHLTFALKAAMVQSFKLKNFGSAMTFATKLLDLNPPQSFVEIVIYS
jgi:coatomer protein complex subunit alpha (xenin)